MSERRTLIENRDSAIYGAVPLPDAIGLHGAWGRLIYRLGSLQARFLMIVVAPTLVAALYYCVIASDRYVAHASYLVRGVNSHSAGGISALLSTIGISRTADDTSAIEDFMASRDALRLVDEKLNLRALYGLRGVDFLSRYPRFWERDTFERLYARSQNYITVAQDQITGISTLTVEAFRPEDSKAIADTLIVLAEDMVNRMNERARRDTIRTAEREVDEAHQAVLAAEDKLTAFRNEEFLIDPVSYAAVLMQTIGELAQERSRAQAEVSRTAALSPTAPNLTALQARISALGDKMSQVRTSLAGNDLALAGKLATYDRMILESKLSEKRYEAALVSLQTAQQEAQRQQVYIEELVKPNLTDDSTEPERGRRILTIFVAAFAIFSMVWILTVGAKDHAQ